MMDYYCEICGKKLEGSRRKLCPECAKNPGKTAKRKKEKTKPYTYAPGLSARSNTKQCKTCKYWNDTTPCCDYYFITGKLKLCDAPPNCTKYEKGKREIVKKPFSFQEW